MGDSLVAPFPMDMVANVPSVLGVSFIHILTISICIAAFVYQWRVLEYPRIFRNLAYCWSVMGISYLSSGLNTIIKSIYSGVLWWLAPGRDGSNVFSFFDRAWTVSDIVMSLISSYFLIRVAYLIGKYNEPLKTENIKKGWSASSQMVLAILISFTLLGLANGMYLIAGLMGIVEVGLGAFAAVWVGRAFFLWKGTPYPKTQEARYPIFLLITLKYATLVTFLIWGGLQIPYAGIHLTRLTGWNVPLLNVLGIGDSGPGDLYAVGLMALKLICGMCAVAYGIIYVEDKRFATRIEDGVPMTPDA